MWSCFRTNATKKLSHYHTSTSSIDKARDHWRRFLCSCRQQSSSNGDIKLPILPEVKVRNALMSILNPFADMPHLVRQESIVYERVQNFGSTTALVTALLCGISGSALLQEVISEKETVDSLTSAISCEDTLCHVALLTTPLREIRLALLCFSFLCNSQGILLSSLMLTALNTTPVGCVRHFVTQNSILVSALGWSLVPGTLSLCAASAITAKLVLSSPLDDIVTPCCVGILTATFGVASFLLLQNHRIRSQLIKQLVARKNTSHPSSTKG